MASPSSALQDDFTPIQAPVQQDDFTPYDAKKRGSKLKGTTDSTILDQFLELLRPVVAPAAAATVGAASGPAGLVTAPVTYAAVDAGMQKMQSKPPRGLVSSATSMEPGGVASTLTNTAEQAALGKLGEVVFGGLTKIPAAISAYKGPGSSQLERLGATYSGLTGSKVARWIEDTFAPGSKVRAQEASVPLIKQEGKQLASQVTGRPINDATDPFFLASNIKADAENLAIHYAERPQNIFFQKDGLGKLVNTTTSPIPEVEAILKDPVVLQRTMSAGKLKLPNGKALQSTNIRRDLQGYELNQLLQLKPIEALEALGNDFNRQKYTTLFSQANRADIEQFFKNAAITQQKIAGNAKTALGVKILSIPGGIHAAASLFAGHMTPYSVAGGVMAGVNLGGTALAKVMTNPKLARVMVSLAAGQAPGISDQAISRMLVGTLQGTGAVIRLRGADGSETPGTIEEGQFVPLQ